MKRWWTVLATRIDALSLRERVFLFATLLVLCGLLADVLWLTPAQTVHQQLRQRVTAQEAELQRLREELRASSGESGTGRQLRAELAQLHERIAEVNQAIEATPRADADETPLSRVLAHFLRRHPGLVLVRTATLPADPRSNDTLQRQGMELTVAGPYAELVRYVQTLEQALPALRWGGLKLDSQNPPTELTLQVWLVRGMP